MKFLIDAQLPRRFCSWLAGRSPSAYLYAKPAGITPQVHFSSTLGRISQAPQTIPIDFSMIFHLTTQIRHHEALYNAPQGVYF